MGSSLKLSPRFGRLYSAALLVVQDHHQEQGFLELFKT